MKTNKIAICALALSIIALCLTLFRVTPLEFSNDIYLGLLATFIGIAVTMLIGYQIFNMFEMKKEVSEQRKLANDLKQMSEDLNKTIEKQKNEMQEGFDIISTLVNYQENGWTSSIQAFGSLHRALVASLKTERTEYGWIFNLLRKYIADINWQNFVGGFALLKDGRAICNTPDSPHYQKELKDIAKEYTDIVDADEVIIRADENFCRIQMEYDRVMRLFRKRINEVLKDPNKNLTPEDKFAITNPY